MNLGKYRRKSDKSGKKSKNLHAVSQFCTKIRRAFRYEIEILAGAKKNDTF